MKAGRTDRKGETNRKETVITYNDLKKNGREMCKQERKQDKIKIQNDKEIIKIKNIKQV